MESKFIVITPIPGDLPAHRSTYIEQYIMNDFIIDNVNMFVSKLRIDNLWWIIPTLPIDELDTDDLGPFNNSCDAVLMAILLAS